MQCVHRGGRPTDPGRSEEETGGVFLCLGEGGQCISLPFNLCESRTRRERGGDTRSCGSWTSAPYSLLVPQMMKHKHRHPNFPNLQGRAGLGASVVSWRRQHCGGRYRTRIREQTEGQGRGREELSPAPLLSSGSASGLHPLWQHWNV